MFDSSSITMSINVVQSALIAAFIAGANSSFFFTLVPVSPYASANAGEAIERLSRAKDILKEHGNYDWLTEYGNLIASNNGIEWAATYFLILLALFVTGGGKFVSVDYWLAKKFRGQSCKLA